MFSKLYFVCVICVVLCRSNSLASDIEASRNAHKKTVEEKQSVIRRADIAEAAEQEARAQVASLVHLLNLINKNIFKSSIYFTKLCFLIFV